ncbi:MAG: glycosyltransferase family 9 protein [Alphaproteobacteria bacterium]|nr:glycosyltransferase family 9 protein [Alphaproteobacteria bacterium]
MASKISEIKSIAVIVGLDLIGDALIKLSFVRALRAAFPAAHISWLTAQGRTAFAGPLRAIAAPFIDAVVERPDYLAALQDKNSAIALPHFDLVIDTRGRWRWALQARRLPHKVFIAPAARFLFSERRPPCCWRKPDHMQDRLLQLVELAAGQAPVVRGGIAVPADDRAKATQILPDGQTYIGLVPGAGNTVKIWPLPRFIALAESQVSAGRVPTFLLGPQETGWLTELQSKFASAKFPLQEPVWGGQLSLTATMAVGERLKLCVTNDNGTSHMLAAVDCPLISLFGPTAAQKLAPRVSHRRVIMAQQFGQDAMDAIPVAAVTAAVEELLKELGHGA